MLWVNPGLSVRSLVHIKHCLRETGRTIIHFLVTSNTRKSLVAVVVTVVIMAEPSQKHLVMQIGRGCLSSSYRSTLWQEWH